MKTTSDKRREKVTVTFHKLNFLLGVIGMVGVWETTHNWWAMFWAFIAALHISYTKYEN